MKMLRMVVLNAPGYRYQFVTKEKDITPGLLAAHLNWVLADVNDTEFRDALVEPLYDVSAEVWMSLIKGDAFFGPLSVTVMKIPYFKMMGE